MEHYEIAWRVAVYLSEHDTAPGKHEPLWETLLEWLNDERAAGATVIRGLGGFGGTHKIKLARIADLVPNLPVIVEWIDSPQTVERLLPRVRELAEGAHITLAEVRLVG